METTARAASVGRGAGTRPPSLSSGWEERWGQLVWGPFPRSPANGMEVRDWQRAREPLSDRDLFFFF